MKYLIEIDKEAFARKLLEMETDDTIEFATSAIWNDDDNCWSDAECWYFATKMYIRGYESRFILIDYCGGEEAFAIPINCNSDKSDAEDMEIVKEYVSRFWEECRGDICNQVYVEAEENV